jgi:hypothetical protein
MGISSISTRKPPSKKVSLYDSVKHLLIVSLKQYLDYDQLYAVLLYRARQSLFGI